MITFILIFAFIILAGGGWLIANGATKRKRSGQAGEAQVVAQQEGNSAPTVGRATGTN